VYDVKLCLLTYCVMDDLMKVVYSVEGCCSMPSLCASWHTETLPPSTMPSVLTVTPPTALMLEDRRHLSASTLYRLSQKHNNNQIYFRLHYIYVTLSFDGHLSRTTWVSQHQNSHKHWLTFGVLNFLTVTPNLLPRPVPPLRFNTRVNPEDTVEWYMKNPRTRTYTSFILDLIRDRIVGNNHVVISQSQRCLHGIRWWLYCCRMYTVYVTILQLYNHCLTTLTLNVNICSTRLEPTARLTQ